jgi:hypothetical protein
MQDNKMGFMAIIPDHLSAALGTLLRHAALRSLFLEGGGVGLWTIGGYISDATSG